MSYASLVKRNENPKASTRYSSAKHSTGKQRKQSGRSKFSVTRLFDICPGETAFISTRQGKNLQSVFKGVERSVDGVPAALVFADGVLPIHEIVSFKVVLLDGSQMPSKGFKTDSEISGNRNTERELQRFQLDVVNGQKGLDDETVGIPKGSWDQFETNRQQFGVKSSYHENLYTTEIDRTDPDYSRNSARAQRVADEILGQTSKNIHLQEERDHITKDTDMDEETRFSSVLDTPSKPITYLDKVKGTAAEEALAKEKKIDPSKSKLNPNAKSFTFNPKASSFTPRTEIPPQVPPQSHPYYLPQGYAPPGYHGYY